MARFANNALLLAIAAAFAVTACTRADEPAPAKDGATSAAKPSQAEGSAMPPKLAELFPPDPEENMPIVSPFGDRYDPLRGRPPDPVTTGPGITTAVLAAAGAARVEELRRPANEAAPFYAAVVDVTIAPGSTTDVLGPESITLASDGGAPVPLFAACMPTLLEDAGEIYYGNGTKMAAWTVAIDGKTWRCGGRTARMALRVGPGGFRLTVPAAGWSGPMVLLFERQPEPPESIALAGKAVAIPAKQ